MGICGFRQLVKLILLKYIPYVRTLLGAECKGKEIVLKNKMKQNIIFDLRWFTIQRDHINKPR